MGAFLDKPKTDKLLEDGAGNGLRYGVASMQGWRVEMEDAHMAKTNLGEGALKDWSYFAVFDGHAGARVSAHCAEHLLDAIMATEEFQEDVMKGIHNGFLQLDNKMRTLPEMSSGEDKSGSTAVCALISSRLIYIGKHVVNIAFSNLHAQILIFVCLNKERAHQKSILINKLIKVRLGCKTGTWRHLAVNKRTKTLYTG